MKPEPGVAAAPAAAGAAAEGDAAGGTAAAAAGDAAVASGQVVMPWVSPPPVYTLTIYCAHVRIGACACACVGAGSSADYHTPRDTHCGLSS